MPDISQSQWSETDGSNNNAAPNGFPEGMAPSGVNDAARMAMGALKRFWTRVNGTLTTAGAGNAYTLTYGVAPPAYVTGEIYSFKADRANTGAATLNVNSLGAKDIRKQENASLAAAIAGDIRANQMVTVVYDGTLFVMLSPLGNAAVYSSRQVLTASGLSGGGDLSADRTVALDVNALTEDTAPDATSDFLLEYDASASSHKKVKISRVAALPRSYLAGFGIANNATDAVNDLDVTAGEARDDGDANDLSSSATIIKQIDVTFAEYTTPSTPSGGRDSADNLTGAKWFNVYMVGGAGKNAQPFFATSASPTLPTGFTFKRRIGSVRWSGTAIVAFVQAGVEFIWKDPPLDVDVTNLGTTTTLYTLTVPIGARVRARLNALASFGTGAAYVYLNTPDADDEATSATTAPLGNIYMVVGGGGANMGSFFILTDTSAQIQAVASQASSTLKVATLGWIDRRGRDD